MERELRESSAGIEVQNRGVHELVGMDWLQDASLPNFDFMRMEHELRRRYGDALTVSHWLEHFPPAWGFRERLKRFMAEVMAEIRAHNEQKLTSGQGWRPVNVVVGSHTPIAEFALLDPKMGTGLGHADAVLYEVNSDGAIVGHEHLRCSLTR
ncbi:MAG: hypothetical protein JW384_01037 [Nitrosomonadaceae bacterium]|nr:hypothetical protein [Nitrosomonadaceae bacterium]